MIRRWRGLRGLSQQALAEQAEVSTRHLSCVETGRAAPSREMLLVLASALELPLRERNVWLVEAGFAPAYRDLGLEGEAQAPVRQAVAHLLRGAEPYGALVMNHRWELICANRAWQRLCQLSLGRELDAGENMMLLVFTELWPFLEDAEVLGRVLLRRLHREAVHGADAELHSLVARIAALPSAPSGWEGELGLGAEPVAQTVGFVMGQHRLSLFTTLTTLGTSLDVSASELRIEHYFPADTATELLLHDLARMVP